MIDFTALDIYFPEPELRAPEPEPRLADFERELKALEPDAEIRRDDLRRVVRVTLPGYGTTEVPYAHTEHPFSAARCAQLVLQRRRF